MEGFALPALTLLALAASICWILRSNAVAAPPLPPGPISDRVELELQILGSTRLRSNNNSMCESEDVITGGTDNTATAIEWAMAELLRNPSVMAKVQQELTDVIGEHNIVEESHLSKLVYLDAVVKETLRMHPGLPLSVPRIPSQSTTLGGYSIPKGTKVFLNTWWVSMDLQLWKEPSKFEPVRFLNEHAGVEYIGNNFQYLPFGSGRRVCPGITLGERMVIYLLATLLHSFEWQLSEGEGIDLSSKFGIVMRKSTPLLAIPYQRLSDLNLYA